MIKVEEVAIKTQIKYCDICGNKILTQYRSSQCKICHRDICCECGVEDPEDSLYDNPGAFCYSCSDIGDKYIDQIFEEKCKCEEKCEQIKQQWKKEAFDKINGVNK
jgi:hypothetical protein